MQDREQTLVEHLAELRERIIKALIAVVVGVIVSVFISQPVFKYIMDQAKADGVQLIQYTFGDTFLTQFKLAIILGLVLAFPVVLYQIVAFILPALTPGEKRLLYIGLPFATALFLSGWAFGWFVVVPITKQFFQSMAQGVGVVEAITPSNYVSFILGICNPLGIAFELPLVVLILARLGLVTHHFLSRVRKYAFLAIMILAAVLSPPDVISMVIFLVPLYGLYEFSIFLARFAAPKEK
ncbi:sec-independent protein translocase protein TatC [Symbiobacterium terraclitae]|jgi:sec-independent protein translocase protein TatC|uniref:Sec-independent protein translocase protein TatC n=1 Tax=Symbiobacterium terraclitae TaxID=557451 RepID=A0ABS4JP20_9FIRM|nr:twin-arginine translocase subunit TatC [Symbiobacterium terraclitae]MBP2017260.1 sec-independent protein translocase protein TatC [Symbiobacterium terraclitae]